MLIRKDLFPKEYRRMEKFHQGILLVHTVAIIIGAM